MTWPPPTRPVGGMSNLTNQQDLHPSEHQAIVDMLGDVETEVSRLGTVESGLDARITALEAEGWQTESMAAGPGDPAWYFSDNDGTDVSDLAGDAEWRVRSGLLHCQINGTIATPRTIGNLRFFHPMAAPRSSLASNLIGIWSGSAISGEGPGLIVYGASNKLALLNATGGLMTAVTTVNAGTITMQFAYPTTAADT